MTAALQSSQNNGRQSLTVSLQAIVGVSELNPRFFDDREDIDGLAASLLASGQLQPLLVMTTDHPSRPANWVGDFYVVLDGQRRWRAMQLLADQNGGAAHYAVDVEVFAADEPSLREIALAANTMRRPLHPVEEYEAFVAMARAGFDEERIARDFGLGLRHVRQRLALGRLSPKILTAWREGKINADVAQAYTAGDAHAAQEAVFDQLSTGGHYPHQIRQKLRSDALPGQSKEAVYVGADAYIAAGGRIEENLFEEEIIFRDGTLLKRLAREKLLAAAEAIAEKEGWGFVVAGGDQPDGGYLVEDYEVDFLPAEEQRLEAIEDEENAVIAAHGPNHARINELWAERDGIETRALLRSIPQSQRATLGLVADLQLDGTPMFGRGFEASPATRSDGLSVRDSAPPAPRSVEKGAAAELSPLSVAAPDKTSKAVRAVIDEAVENSFSECIRSRPDLALMVAVAKLGTDYGQAYGCVGLSITSNQSFEARSELLKRIGRLRFNEALAICANAPLVDLSVAFTELVARSIRIVGDSLRGEVPLSDLTPLAAALSMRGAPLAAQLDQAFDRKAYFDAATKGAALAVVDAIGTPAINRADKKGAIADYVAADATKKKWLPAPLAAWAETPATSLELPRQEQDERPLAQAMVEAIDADEDEAAEEASGSHAIPSHKTAVHFFLEEVMDCSTGVERPQTKASVLHQAYLNFAAGRGLPELSITAFSAAILALGYEKKRIKTGVHYLGIALREQVDEAA